MTPPRQSRAGWALATVLAGLLTACASPGPVESRRSPSLPDQPPTQIPPRQQPALPAPGLPPPPASPARPPVVVAPAPAPKPAVVPPLVVPYLSERDGRALVARFLPSQVRDRDGWAADIFSAFAALKIPPTADNICAAVAVIEQESTFQADPPVPGLSQIVWKEIEARRERLHLPRLLVDTAMLKTSPDGRSYKARIDALRTERQMSELFDEMISEFPNGKALLGGYNPVRTGGPMQVSVSFAEEQVREKPYPYARRGSIRNEVFTRRGGLYFGIAILLDYPAPYSQPLYRFADFNAGRYSSRNVAFQAAVARLGGRALTLDGDLLRYRDGAPSGEPSATQRALLPLAGRLRLSKAEMLRDLKQEKAASFARTPLYQRVFALADQAAGGRMPRETMPKIRLKSPKIHRRLTTEWFAERVDWRYRSCLGRGQGL